MWLILGKAEKEPKQVDKKISAELIFTSFTVSDPIFCEI